MIHTRFDQRHYADQVSMQAAQMLVLAFGEADPITRAEMIGFATRMAEHARWLTRATRSDFAQPGHEFDEVAGAVAAV